MTNHNRPLAKALFATEHPEKMSFNSFSQRSSCALWLYCSYLCKRSTKAFLFPILVLALTLPACSSNTVVVSTPTNAIVVVPTATAQPMPAQITPIPFGAAVDIDDMKFMITGAIRPADGIVSAGDMFNAQPGKYEQYLFVTLAITCAVDIDQQCHLDLFKIKLLGSDGTLKYPKWFISGVESILKDTDFQGGTTVSGNVPFIISVGDSRLLLIYESLAKDSFYFALP